MRPLLLTLLLFFAANTALASPAENEKGFGCDFIIFIDFDDMSAPDSFAATTPLSDEYSSYGVFFSGPGPDLGGAVLNDGSGFGVTGFTPPNFLAFSDLSYALVPETLIFTTANEFVSIEVGSSTNGNATLSCFDAEDELVGTTTISLTPALQSMAIEASGMLRCTLDSTAPETVFDDLLFLPCLGTEPPVIAIPALSPWSMAVLIVLLAAIAVWRLPRK